MFQEIPKYYIFTNDTRAAKDFRLP